MCAVRWCPNVVLGSPWPNGNDVAGLSNNFSSGAVSPRNSNEIEQAQDSKQVQLRCRCRAPPCRYGSEVAIIMIIIIKWNFHAESFKI